MDRHKEREKKEKDGREGLNALSMFEEDYFGFGNKEGRKDPLIDWESWIDTKKERRRKKMEEKG